MKNYRLQSKFMGNCILTTIFFLSTVGCTANALFTQLSTIIPIPANHVSSEISTPASSLLLNCSVSQITRLIDNFIKSYNTGSFDEIGQYFDLDRFEYFVGGQKADQPYKEIWTSNRAELLAYFRQRHAHHEEIYQVKPIQVSPDSNGSDEVVITFYLSRHADDFFGAEINGKAVIDCKTSKVSRWIWYGFNLS